MVGIQQVIGDSLRRSWYLLIPILLICNGFAYSLPLLSSSSYQVEDSEMMTLHANHFENQLLMTYQIFSDRIYTLSNSSIVVYDSQLKELWSYDVSQDYNLISRDYTPLKIVRVNDDGVYVSYIVENEVSLDVKLGIFTEHGEVNSWIYSRIPSKFLENSSFKANYIINNVALNTEMGQKILTYSVNLMGYYDEETSNIFFSQFCDRKITQLLEDTVVVLLEGTKSVCSYDMNPDSYILDGNLYLSFNQSLSDTRPVFYRYDPGTSNFHADTKLNDTINLIYSSEKKLEFKNFIILKNRLYTIWYYSSDPYSPNVEEGHFSRSFIYIYQDTSLVATLNATSYLDLQFQERNQNTIFSLQSATFCPNNMNTAALVSCYNFVTYQIQPVEISPKNYFFLADFFYMDPTISIRSHAILEFLPFEGELSVHHTLINAPTNLIEYYFMQLDKLGPSKLLLYGTTLNVDNFQPIFLVQSLTPANIVAWVDTTTFLQRYIVPSVLMILLVLIIRFPRGKRPTFNGKMYPENDESVLSKMD